MKSRNLVVRIMFRYDPVTIAHLLHSSSLSALCFQQRAHLVFSVLDSVMRTLPRVAENQFFGPKAPHLNSPSPISLSAKGTVASSPRLTDEIPNIDGKSSSAGQLCQAIDRIGHSQNRTSTRKASPSANIVNVVSSMFLMCLKLSANPQIINEPFHPQIFPELIDGRA